MPTQRPPPFTQISTDAVPPSQRLDYWEAYNASVLVGLKCSSFAEGGLRATQSNVDLGVVRLAEIRGNEHVIERTPHLARMHPKDSVFASLVLESSAFFYQGKACEQVEPGELLVYDTRHAYLFGFTGNMRLLLLDMPSAWFHTHCVRDTPARPVKIHAGTGSGRVLSVALRKLLAGVMRRPAAADAASVPEEACELLRAMLLDQIGGARVSALRASHMLVARSFIDDHLHDAALCAEQVAQAAGVSLRHLNRLFAADGLTVSQVILERRLERAATDLRAPALRRYSVAEIAYRRGFASQAHLARVFRARFAMTPTQMRSASEA
ncbi:helix-turn-helix domain-containing protein [Cupriavidus sp. 8B]